MRKFRDRLFTDCAFLNRMLAENVIRMQLIPDAATEHGYRLHVGLTKAQADYELERLARK